MDSSGIGPHDALLDAFDAYLRHERRASPHTARCYVADVRAALLAAAASGAADPAQWNVGLLRSHLGRLTTKAGRRVQPVTLARKQSALRSFCRWLQRTGRMNPDVDPTARLQTPKLPQPLPRALDADAVMALMRAPQSDEGDPGKERTLRDQAALCLLYGLGLRLSEAAELRDADLQLDGDEASARVLGKGQKERIVPVPALCIEPLRAYRTTRRPRRKDPTYLVGRGGGPLSTRTVARAVERLAFERLARHVTPHQLRHTFATHLLAGGANLRHVQALLGHARLTATQRYTRVAVERLATVYDEAHPRSD